MLRHGFATHLVMNWVNMREILELSEHKDIEPPMSDTHGIWKLINALQSPSNMLYSGK
jgi:site-specific recombinase XerD